MAKELVVRFDIKTGETHVEAMGFTGNSCEKASEFIKKTLGEMTDFQKKSEYFEDNLKEGGYFNTNLCG